MTGGSKPRLSGKERRLVVEVEAEQPLRLEDLLGGVTDENLHGEWQMAPSAGKESR